MSRHSENPPAIHLCAPEIFGGHGGIQTYMRLLIRAVSDQNRLGSVFALGDTSKDERARRWSSRFDFDFFPSEGSKLRFAWHIGTRTQPDDHLIFGHINQSPLGPIFQKAGRISKYGIILHGIEAWQKLAWPKRMALDRAALAVSTTPYTRTRVHQCNEVNPAHHEILPLALEPDRFSPDASTPHSGDSTTNHPNQLNVLTVARLDANERYKGVDHVLTAVARYREHGSEISYTVIGDGSDRARLEQITASLEVDDHVRFLGYVSDERLGRAFEAADVFAMPSKGEGFGLVYLEAMSHGLPVIASPEGGAQHVITEEKDGLLVEYGDIAALVDAFEKLSSEPFRQQLSEGAQKSAAGKYSFERFNEKLNAIMEYL